MLGQEEAAEGWELEEVEANAAGGVEEVNRIFLK
jgi:hypothetical protein